MPVKFECECGKRLSVPDERAGVRVQCPGCGKAVEVPGSSAVATRIESGAPGISGPIPISPSLSEFLKGSVGELRTVVLRKSEDDLAGVRELIAGTRKEDSLGRYPALGSLGRGGMGEVLLVRDPEIGRELAAKVILGGRHADRKLLEKFLLEAQVTGQLEHPNIVPVHELGVATDGRVYFTMKRVRGKDLEKVLAEVARAGDGPSSSTSGRRRRAARASGVRRVATPEEAEHSLVRLLEVFLKTCDAVAFAHSRGVIHRDLKPANVMVGEFGEVLVMDWGLAKVLGHPDAAPAQVAPDLTGAKVARKARGRTGHADEPIEAEPLRTQDGSVMGTPAYMPPEQARGDIRALDDRSDVYSLGAILYQILTLSPPFAGGNQWKILHEVTQGELVPPSARAPGRHVPRELEAAVTRAMAKDPARRYASVAGLRADIEAYLAGRTLAAARYTPWQRAAKWVMRNKAVSAVSAAAAVVLVAASAGFIWKILVEKGKAEESARVAEERANEAERERERADKKAEEIRRKSERDSDSIEVGRRREELAKLWPAEPAKIPDMETWLDRVGTLISKREDHRRAKAELEAKGSRSADEDWVLSQEDGIVSGLAVIEAGTSDVPRRIERARELERRMAAYEEDWNRALARIETNDSYAELDLAQPIFGLAPLGPDPESGLEEFAHLATGLPPVRGEGGRFTIAEESAIVLVLVPAGSFRMGSDGSRYSNEKPAHDVQMGAFFLSKYEMTQGQWKRATGNDPSYYHNHPCEPVEQVSWDDCHETAFRLGLRLPSEAEWEYAARAGTTSEWWTGGQMEDLGAAGNVADQTGVRAGLSQGEAWNDSHGPPAAVGSYRANPFGLHDTIGNVWEWCEDTYHDNYEGAPADGSAWLGKGASDRVNRGGSYALLAVLARSASRSGSAASFRVNVLGVRLARGITPP